MNNQGSLGQRLRDLRLRKGLSQAELALPELSDSYISLIESDKRTPAADVIELLARKLECSPSYLRSGVGDDVVAELRTAFEYGQIALDSGEAEEARGSFAKVISCPDLPALPDLEYKARWGYALALESSGDLEGAVAEFERLGVTLSPENDPDRWAWLYIALCRSHRERGDFKAAAEAGEQGLRQLMVTPGPWSESMVMLGATLLSVFFERGDLVFASQFADRLIQRANEAGSPRARAAAYWNAGMAADYRGDVDRALQLVERALALLGESDDARNLAKLREEYGRIMLRARPDQAQRAWDLIQQSRNGHAVSAASEVDGARCMISLANAEIMLGRPDNAVALAEDAIKCLSDGPRLAMASALIVLAHAFLHLGQLHDALETLKQAAEALEGMRSNRQAAQAWFELGDLYGRADDPKRQTEAYRRACACAGI